MAKTFMGTSYRDLLDRLQALTPICRFDVPGVLCDNEELYYRGLYRLADQAITDMVNLASSLEKLQ